LAKERIGTIIVPARIDRTKCSDRTSGNHTDKRRIDTVKVKIPKIVMANAAYQMGIFTLDGTVLENVAQ